MCVRVRSARARVCLCVCVCGCWEGAGFVTGRRAHCCLLAVEESIGCHRVWSPSRELAQQAQYEFLGHCGMWAQPTFICRALDAFL